MNGCVGLIENVHNANAACAEHICNERPVTAPPNRLGTHQRCAQTARQVEQLTQAMGKLSASDVVGIPAECLVLPRIVR